MNLKNLMLVMGALLFSGASAAAECTTRPTQQAACVLAADDPAVRSTALIVAESTTDGGQCSATLIAAASGDRTRMHLLTAAHCVPTDWAGGIQVSWLHRAECGGAEPPRDPRRYTARLVGTVGDLAVIAIDGPAPPGTRYSAWSAEPVAPGQYAGGQLATVHHAAGRSQQYSAGRVATQDDALWRVDAPVSGGASGSGWRVPGSEPVVAVSSAQYCAAAGGDTQAEVQPLATLNQTMRAALGGDSAAGYDAQPAVAPPAPTPAPAPAPEVSSSGSGGGAVGINFLSMGIFFAVARNFRKIAVLRKRATRA